MSIESIATERGMGANPGQDRSRSGLLQVALSGLVLDYVQM